MTRRIFAVAAALLAVGAMSGCASKGSAAGGGSGGSGGSGGGDGKPPAFAATVPDEYRVLPSAGFHASCGQGNCAVPPSPSLVVKDASGTQIGLLIDPDARVDNPKRMQIRICPHAMASGGGFTMNQCKIHLVAAGDSFTDLGMQVTVRQLWWMSDDKNDALDAVITAV